MDLISQFEKRRGTTPPTRVSSGQASRAEVPDVAQVLAIAFEGGLKRSYLIPVLGPHQSIFGDKIWLCPTEDKARGKQDENTLAFYPGELMDICQLALEDYQQISCLVTAKKLFGGTIKK